MTLGEDEQACGVQESILPLIQRCREICRAIEGAASPAASLYELWLAFYMARSLLRAQQDEPEPDGPGQTELQEPDGPGQTELQAPDRPGHPAVQPFHTALLDPALWLEQETALEARWQAALGRQEYASPVDAWVDLEDEQQLCPAEPPLRIHRDRVYFLVARPGRCWITQARFPELTVMRRCSFRFGGLSVLEVMPTGLGLWVLFSSGSSLLLETDSLEQVLLVNPAPRLGPGQVDVRRARLSPDQQGILLEYAVGATWHVALFDPETGEQLREFPACAGCSFFGGSQQSLLLIVGGTRTAWGVFTSRGHPVAGPQQFSGAQAKLLPVSAVSEPGGAGFYLAALDTAPGEASDQEEIRSAPVHLVQVSAEFRPLASRLVVEESFGPVAILGRMHEGLILLTRSEHQPEVHLVEVSNLEARGNELVDGCAVPLTNARGTIYMLERENRHLRFTLPLTTGPAWFDGPTGLHYPVRVLSPQGNCSMTQEEWCRAELSRQLSPWLLKAAVTQQHRRLATRLALAALDQRTALKQMYDQCPLNFRLYLFGWPPGPELRGSAATHQFFSAAEAAVLMLPGDPAVRDELQRFFDVSDQLHGRAHVW